MLAQCLSHLVHGKPQSVGLSGVGGSPFLTSSQEGHCCWTRDHSSRTLTPGSWWRMAWRAREPEAGRQLGGSRAKELRASLRQSSRDRRRV